MFQSNSPFAYGLFEARINLKYNIFNNINIILYSPDDALILYQLPPLYIVCLLMMLRLREIY
jgi:hypothetical protein